MINLSPNLKILVVEDDYDTRLTIRIMLNELGVLQVFEAEDGKNARSTYDIKKGQLDLIISDWNMPGKTGFEFLNELRESETNIPFLMVTARADHESVINAKDSGVTGYLLKPFTVEELKKKVLTVLAEKNNKIASSHKEDEEHPDVLQNSVSG